MCVCVHVYMHLITISEKEAMNVKESREGYVGDLDGGKRRKKFSN